MNFQSNKLRDAVVVALIAGAATSVTAQAQEATNLDRISVTGSRIKSTDIETSQPVLSLTRADIEKQGVTSVADILQRVAANGAALNRTFNNGGDGSAGVSLRNLGAERTLVLVNGRRWTTGLDGSVDLNTIPVAMIERIDVLKDGASTIYGSDAIAGVVNIITKQNFDGAEANFYKGQYSQGDGEREAADFTIGTTTDRAYDLSHWVNPDQPAAAEGFAGLRDGGDREVFHDHMRGHDDAGGHRVAAGVQQCNAGAV